MGESPSGDAREQASDRWQEQETELADMIAKGDTSVRAAQGRVSQKRKQKQGNADASVRPKTGHLRALYEHQMGLDDDSQCVLDEGQRLLLAVIIGEKSWKSIKGASKVMREVTGEPAGNDAE